MARSLHWIECGIETHCDAVEIGESAYEVSGGSWNIISYFTEDSFRNTFATTTINNTGRHHRRDWLTCIMLPRGGYSIRYWYIHLFSRITYDGGFGLLVDYGHDGDRNSHSVRSYLNHELVDILAHPGRADITADVDFSQVTKAFSQQCTVYGPVSQRYVNTLFSQY